MSRYQSIIGRFEKVDIINQVDNIPAKIDTGAYRSSIHATNVSVVQKSKKKYLRFTILGHPAHGTKRVVEVPNFKKRTVTSSNGHSAERYEVRLKIRLGLKVFTTSFTLTNRTSNVFPILIGRKALSKRFLVDTDKAGISRRDLRKAVTQIDVSEEDLEGINT